jgi:hypothetical protein
MTAMASDELVAKQRELTDLRTRLNELERELHAAPPHWQASEFYIAYYATTGFLLGIFGAMASLMFNVIGSAFFQQHPLRLIQVYLTFPLGERALTLNDGLTLTIGCCLYLGTGMLLGAPFHVLLARFTNGKPFLVRAMGASLLAISMWIGHFYLILSWLQPLLFGGNWIVEQVPWWVGAATHLVYGWTMAIVYPLGTYVPYRRQTEQI